MSVEELKHVSKPDRDMTGLFTALSLRTDWGEAETRTPEEIEAGLELARELIEANERRNTGNTVLGL